MIPGDLLATLREGEGDRRLFVEYLKHELDDKVVLILGYDPSSPDFALLVKHVLSGYLGTVDVCVFLVWPEVGPQHKWGERPIQSICQEPLTLVDLLGAQSI